MNKVLYKDIIESKNFDALMQAMALQLRDSEKLEPSNRWDTTQLFRKRIKTAAPETVRVAIEKGTHSVASAAVSEATRAQLWAVRDVPEVGRAIISRKKFDREFMCFFYYYAKYSADWNTVFTFLSEDASEYVNSYSRRSSEDDDKQKLMQETTKEYENSLTLQVLRLQQKTLRDRWSFIEDGLSKALENKDNGQSLTPVNYVSVESALSQFTNNVYRCGFRFYITEGRYEILR